MILVVDDDPHILAFIQMALEMEGIAVATAANGEIALQQIRQTRPSAVLLDINMPVMDGVTFASQARQEFGCLPIIVMTAGTDVDRYCHELKAEDSLPKPFELLDLLAKVGRFVAA